MKKETKIYYYIFDDINSRKLSIEQLMRKTKSEIIEYFKPSPIITICLIVEKSDNAITSVSRGLSILSKEDKYNKEIGEKEAYRNALRAKKGRSIEPIRRKDAIISLTKTNCPFKEKGYKNCIDSLTPREFTIVYKRDDAIKNFNKKYQIIFLHFDHASKPIYVTPIEYINYVANAEL